MTTPAACVEGVAGNAFESEPVIDHALDVRLVLVGRLQLGIDIDGLFQRHPDVGRDHLRNAVALAIAQAHHAAHVAHHHLRAERAEGDDLRDAIVAVFLADVIDDFRPTVVAKIHVDIGRRDALGIQEALEKQIVAERIDVGDLQQVRHHAAGRAAAARTDGYPVAPGEMHEVPDDQEVADEARLLHDLQFELHALDNRLLVVVLRFLPFDAVPGRAGPGRTSAAGNAHA